MLPNREALVVYLGDVDRRHEDSMYSLQSQTLQHLGETVRAESS